MGFDYKPLFKEALLNNDIYSLVVQDAFRMGEMGVALLIDILNHKKVKPKNYVPVLVVDHKTIKDAAILDKLKQYEQ